MIDVLSGTGPANARPILIFLFFTLIASNPPHYASPSFIVSIPPPRGLFTRGLALPEGRACPRRPHPGLDPGSPANINPEVPRHRDYN